MALVVGMIWVLAHTTLRLLGHPQRRGVTIASQPGRWRVAHYDVDGETRVVLQKVSSAGGELLDEHVIEAFRIDDPDYDARFLQAMSTARERRSLFESEEDG